MNHAHRIGRITSPRARTAVGQAGGSATTVFAFRLFIVLIVFTLLSIPSRWTVVGVFRPTVLLVGLIGLLIWVSHTGGRKDASKTTLLLNILIAYILLSIPFVQWPGSVLRYGLEGFTKAVVFFYFAVHLVDNFQRLRVFVFAILTCQVIRVLEPLYLHVTTGYWGGAAYMSGGQFMDRLSGAPSDIINPNGLAFVILTAIPFLHYLLGASPSKLSKLLYLALIGPMLYAFVLTGSRSGLVGLIVVAAFIIVKSRHRVLLGGVAAVAALGMVAVMSGEMKDRYLSIADRDTQHAATAEGRLDGIMTDLHVALSRPVFGHGVGTSREALFNQSGRDQLSHNLYTEVFIEIGFIGLVMYMAVLGSIVINVRSVTQGVRHISPKEGTAIDREAWSRLDFYQRCADATLGWVVMCLVFSLASYGLSEFYWYMTAGLSVALLNIMETEAHQRGELIARTPEGRIPRRRIHGRV